MTSFWSRWSPERRIAAIALAVFVSDQLSKLIVVTLIPPESERRVLPGFFRWVHWGNTGAAWSQLHGNNGLLAVVAFVALGAFWFWRHQFEAHRPGGQLALGCLMGGIVGNLLDRLARGHVVDFLRFYWTTRSGNEIGFPAFNIADMGITTSVVIILLLSWQGPSSANPSQPGTAPAARSNAPEPAP